MGKYSLSEWTAMAAATFAAVGLSTIPFLQSDYFSRSFLSSKSLQQRRLESYEHQWGKQCKESLTKVLGLWKALELKLLTEDEEILKLVNECMKEGKYQVLAIGVDVTSETLDVCAWILFSEKLYQIPVQQMAPILSKAMESVVFTNTLCFVADSSGGLGVTIVKEVLKTCQTSMPIISEPTWISQLSIFMEQKPRLLSTSLYKQCLMGLIRLQTYQYRKDPTIILTLPGQATVATLEPVLFDLFPHERHVFIYDGCVNTVSRVMVMPQQEIEPSGTPFSRKIGYSTPLFSSLSKQVPKLPEIMQTLPLVAAAATECWMTAVSTYLQIKDGDTERRKLKQPEYLPFCCKIDNLRANDLAIQNLVQFIIGARSRALSVEMVQQATSTLRTTLEKHDNAPKMYFEKEIQEAVFCHKLILLENKTLVDTVYPRKDWSLKSTRKVLGCACCDPEEEEEDEEEDSLKELPNPKRPKFVDGKTTFAFDPTQF